MKERGLFSGANRNKIAIYAICFVNLSYILPSVAMADMVHTFSSYPKEMVMMTLSLPCLTALIGTNLIPMLQSRFSLKVITLAALCLTLGAGAISIIFHNNFIVLLAASGLQGVAYGVFCTIYPLIAAVCFTNHAEQAKVMAGCTAMIQIGRLTFLLVGGVLADIAWYCIYYLLGLAGVALVLVFLLLEDCGTVEKKQSDGPGVFARLVRSGSFWYLASTAALYLVLYYTVSTYASLYVEGYGLGAPSATGVVSALASAIAVGTSLLSARVSRVTKRYTSALAFMGLGVGLLLPGCFRALSAIGLGMIVASAAKSQQMPFVMRQVSAISDDSLRIGAMAFVQTLINIGYFISPQVTTFLGRTLGDGSPSAVYFGSGAVAAAAGVIMLLVELRRAKRSGPGLKMLTL